MSPTETLETPLIGNTERADSFPSCIYDSDDRATYTSQLVSLEFWVTAKIQSFGTAKHKQTTQTTGQTDQGLSRIF